MFMWIIAWHIYNNKYSLSQSSQDENSSDCPFRCIIWHLPLGIRSHYDFQTYSFCTIATPSFKLQWPWGILVTSKEACACKVFSFQLKLLHFHYDCWLLLAIVWLRHQLLTHPKTYNPLLSTGRIFSLVGSSKVLDKFSARKWEWAFCKVQNVLYKKDNYTQLLTLCLCCLLRAALVVDCCFPLFCRW